MHLVLALLKDKSPEREEGKMQKGDCPCVKKLKKRMGICRVRKGRLGARTPGFCPSYGRGVGSGEVVEHRVAGSQTPGFLTTPGKGAGSVTWNSSRAKLRLFLHAFIQRCNCCHPRNNCQEKQEQAEAAKRHPQTWGMVGESGPASPSRRNQDRAHGLHPAKDTNQPFNILPN